MRIFTREPLFVNSKSWYEFQIYNVFLVKLITYVVVNWKTFFSVCSCSNTNCHVKNKIAFKIYLGIWSINCENTFIITTTYTFTYIYFSLFNTIHRIFLCTYMLQLLLVVHFSKISVSRFVFSIFHLVSYLKFPAVFTFLT